MGNRPLFLPPPPLQCSPSPDPCATQPPPPSVSPGCRMRKRVLPVGQARCRRAKETLKQEKQTTDAKMKRERGRKRMASWRLVSSGWRGLYHENTTRAGRGGGGGGKPAHSASSRRVVHRDSEHSIGRGPKGEAIPTNAHKGRAKRTSERIDADREVVNMSILLKITNRRGDYGIIKRRQAGPRWARRPTTAFASWFPKLKKKNLQKIQREGRQKRYI